MRDERTLIWHKAVDYLSRREYASLELRQKLLQKKFESALIDEVLAQLQTDNLLSDARFTESFIRSRMNKGYGELRIKQELKQRGISNELIEHYLPDECDEIWLELAEQVREKKFSSTLPTDKNNMMKQVRFLQYRGFSQSQIWAVVKRST